MTSKQKASGAPQLTRFHNPGPAWTLGLPGERKNAMATKKKANKAKRKGGSKKNKKRNTAKPASSSSPRKAATTNKTNPSKRRSGKKHSHRRKNPFDVAGINLTELAAAGLAAISSQAIVSVITDPTSWLGIGLGIGLAVGAAKFAPRSVKSAVTVGAGVVPAVNLINRVTKNAIGNTITSTLRGFVPAGLLGTGAPAPVAATQQNMAGLRRQGYQGFPAAYSAW